MSARPPDYTSSLPPATQPSRRGGPRPGAGAPRGNLNALKHPPEADRSRFRDLLGQRPDAVAVAGRLLAREHRIVERHASALLRLAIVARHRREVADAVAQGRPLPQPPPFDLRDIDLDPLLDYIERVADRAEAERARRAGALTPANPVLASARDLARAVEQFVPLAAHALDGALGSLPSAAALAALLDAPAVAPDDQAINQSPARPADSPSPAPHQPLNLPSAQPRNCEQPNPAALPSRRRRPLLPVSTQPETAARRAHVPKRQAPLHF